MPTLRRFANENGFYVTSVIKGRLVMFQLTDLGSNHLTKTLRLRNRSHFAREHLIDLVDRKWASSSGHGLGDILTALLAESQSDMYDVRFESAEDARSQRRINIRLEGGDGGVLDQVLREFVDAITKGPCVLLGPYPLPTRVEAYRVFARSTVTSHQVRTHKRLMIVLDPDAQFLERTARLSVPPGVDLKIRESRVIV